MNERNESSNERLAPRPKKKRAWMLGLIIPLFVLLPVWFFFIGPQMRHDRLVEKGIKAKGRLLSVDETGTYVNDAPELELSVEFRRSDGVLDTAVTDFIPSLRSLHMFQPGVAVTAAYDPEDPTELTIIDLSSGPTYSTSSPSTTAPANLDSLQRVADSLRDEINRLQSH
ncbi:MAG: hypothetical protein H7X80_11630 [bacterium]|nr:hypothetical protein [Candidatus Kapabacteria bacterium]